MIVSLAIVPNTLPPVSLPAGIVLPALQRKMIDGEARLYRQAQSNVSNEDHLKACWMANKKEFLLRGYNVKKENEKLYLVQWLRPHGDRYTLTPKGQERLDYYLNPPGSEREVYANAEPEYKPLPGDLEKKLRPHQTQPSRQILRALVNGKAEWGYPGAAELSDMGTGKSYTTLAASLAIGRKPAVLCPSVGQNGWSKAFAHFGAEPYFIGTYEGTRGGFRDHVVHKDPATGDFRWRNAHEIILILDEAQALRHEETLTVRCCKSAINQGIPIIVASATIATSPVEFRFAGRITGLHKGADDWERFLFRHGCTRNRKDSRNWVWDGQAHHLEKIHGQLFPRRGCRVRKEDLGDACPETEISLLPFDVEDGQEIQQQWLAAQRTIQNLKAQGKNTLNYERTARMAIWKRCEISIVPHIAKQIRKDVQDGFSVACFCNFDDSRLAIGNLLGDNSGFYGGQSLKKRAYLEREFQEDRLFTLISNMKAGGASVNLQDVKGWRQRKAYIFPTDFIIAMVQATGRVDRLDGKSKSLQYIPYVRGSMTEKMIERTRWKMRNISRLNDGTNAGEDRF
jgi:hypothetical protein